jgi:hypothetical protein
MAPRSNISPSFIPMAARIILALVAIAITGIFIGSVVLGIALLHANQIRAEESIGRAIGHVLRGVNQGSQP